MKRFLLALLFLALVTMLFAAGKAEEVEEEKPVTVTMFHTYGEGSKKAARDNWFAKFDAKYPEVLLERTRFNLSDCHQKLLTSIAAGTPPDLVNNHYYYFPQYASRNQLEPLEPYFEKIGVDPKEIFYSSALEMGMYNGVLYSVPQFTYSRALLYNKNMFRAAGLDPEKPPKTWDELVEVAKKLTVWDQNKLVTAGFQPPRPDEKEHLVNYFIMMVWQQGGDIFTPDLSKVTLNTPQCINALNFYSDLFNTHKLSTVTFGAGSQAAQKPFLIGQSAMVVGGNYDLIFAQQTGQGIDVSAAPLPIPEGGQYASILDSFNIAMLKGSKNKEAAWKVIEYVASQEAQREFAVLSANYPARKDATDDPFFSDPSMKAFIDSMEYARAIPPLPQWSEIQEILSNAIESVLIGKNDSVTALREAENRINTVVLK